MIVISPGELAGLAVEPATDSSIPLDNHNAPLGELLHQGSARLSIAHGRCERSLLDSLGLGSQKFAIHFLINAEIVVKLRHHPAWPVFECGVEEQDLTVLVTCLIWLVPIQVKRFRHFSHTIGSREVFFDHYHNFQVARKTQLLSSNDAEITIMDLNNSTDPADRWGGRQSDLIIGVETSHHLSCPR